MSDARPLGRRTPEDWSHVDAYPLELSQLAATPVPVAIGVNWYSDFDNPIFKSGRWMIGLEHSNLGSIRGGHCVCLEPGDQLNADGSVARNLQDSSGWYSFYDQGREGACVGFGLTRMMSLLNRKRYDARWLWDMAKAVDEWSDTNPGDDNGTSVHAGARILAGRGHVVWKSSYEGATWQKRDEEVPVVAEGITGTYRWATSVDQVRAALQSPANDRMQAVRILNSWGTGYPHRVWMPYATLQRLLDEDGEATLITDR